MAATWYGDDSPHLARLAHRVNRRGWRKRSKFKSWVATCLGSDRRFPGTATCPRPRLAGFGALESFVPGAHVLCCKGEAKTRTATGIAHLYAMPPQLPSSSFFQGLKSSAARGTQRLVLQRGMHSCMPCRPSYPLPPSRLSQPPARSEVGVVVILVTITPGIAIDWVAGRSHSPRARWLNVQSGQRKRLRRERCPCDRWY